MSKLYACIISGGDKEKLVSIAGAFSYRIERLDDGILFDVSGLKNLIGQPSEIAHRISDELAKNSLIANITLANNAESAIIQARNTCGVSIVTESGLNQLSLSSLSIEPDTLGVLEALGFRNVADLKTIPQIDLIARYGLEFQDILDVALNNGKYILTPNLKEYKMGWGYELDFPVSNFEQLTFIVRQGLEKVFEETSHYGFKTEQIDIQLKLDKQPEKNYQIKVSFPSLDVKFWLKVIDLRISLDPPEAGIISIEITCHFAKPRSAQKGLFSATKPEPESLLLTVGKIKKLLGQENVGVPVILDKRLPKAFALDHDKLPAGIENVNNNPPAPAVSISYFDPPLPADVMISQKRLIYLRTDHFKGKVKEYGGIWKASSNWWNPFLWKTEEWDVEIEGGGIYRIQRAKDGWFVVGEYD